MAAQEPPAAEADTELATYIAGQVDAEVARVQALGQRCLRLNCKNFTIVVDAAAKPGKKGAEPLNRVELDTGFDFAKVRQILSSPPVPVPGRAGWHYVHVILISASPVALIFGYLYPETPKNELLRWCLVNNQGAAATHIMRDTSTVTEGKAA